MQIKPQNSTIRQLVMLCVMTGVFAVSAAQTSDPLLFESEAALELTMPVNFDNLCRPSEFLDCDYTPTVFEYLDSAGNHLLGANSYSSGYW